MKIIVTESQIKSIRSKMSDLDEDLFLKKDPETKKLIIFSDKEDKNARTKETIALAKEFRKLGFDWRPDLGHWIGEYDKLPVINNLIKTHNKIRDVVDELENLEDFVAASDINPTAKNMIMDNLDKYIEDLANATDLAAMDAAIRNYLTFYSKFHHYSFTNSILIFIQKPDATKVASYDDWKKVNRGVSKKPTPIYIRFPMFPGRKGAESSDDDTDKNGAPMKYGWGKVYDISDTYELNEKGKVPEQPKWFASNEPSEVADEIVARVHEFAKDLGINITKDTANGKERGYSSGGHINLSSDVEGVGAASTLVHEMAHELLHWKEKSPFYMEGATREMQELQAESVSYVVMKHYNLPVEQHPTYLVLWRANRDKIKANLQTIQKCAKYIIDGIDAQDVPQKQPEDTLKENFQPKSTRNYEQTKNQWAQINTDKSDRRGFGEGVSPNFQSAKTTAFQNAKMVIGKKEGDYHFTTKIKDTLVKKMNGLFHYMVVLYPEMDQVKFGGDAAGAVNPGDIYFS